MKRNIFIVLIFALLVHYVPVVNSGGMKSEHNKSVNEFISVPVLEECEGFVLDFFSTLRRQHGVNYTYNKFNIILESHKEIIGYIKVKKSDSRKVNLLPKFMLLKSQCYPVVSYRVSRNHPYAFTVIERKIIENEKNGITNNYIVLDNGDIYLYFHDTKLITIKKKY